MSIEQDIAKVELIRDFLMRNAPRTKLGSPREPYNKWIDRCEYEIKKAKMWLRASREGIT